MSGEPELVHGTLIAYGITGMREMGTAAVPLAEQQRWREATTSGAWVGPRPLITGNYIEGVTTPAAGKRVVDSLKAAGADHIKLHDDSMSPDVFFVIVAEARRVGLRVIGHLPGVSVEEASDSGMRTIEHAGAWWTSEGRRPAAIVARWRANMMTALGGERSRRVTEPECHRAPSSNEDTVTDMLTTPRRCRARHERTRRPARRGMARAALSAAGLLAALAAHPLEAQGRGRTADTVLTAAGPDGAQAITADDVRRDIGIIAHDSMRGRNTPSPELTKTAQYVADQFKTLGLRPAADFPHAVAVLSDPSGNTDTSWIQDYPVLGSRRVYSMGLTFTARLQHGGKNVINEISTPVDFAATIGGCAAVDTIPESGGRGRWAQAVQSRMLLFTGRHTPASVARARPVGEVVLYLPPAEIDSAAEHAVIEALRASNNVIVLANEDSAAFEVRRAATRPPVALSQAFEGGPTTYHWAAYAWQGALNEFLRVAGLDLAALRANVTPRVHEVRSIGAALMPGADADSSSRAPGTAPNVAALLPGADSALRNQFVVVAAHMDHTGMNRGQADRTHNGANDNASGVAGLLALARAFSQPGARPKRSLLFLATSGGAKGKAHWGANSYLTSDIVALVMVANLTLDMIGRAPGDSVLVAGLSDYDFVTRPDWVVAQHPELGVRLVDDGSITTTFSDHVAFIQRAVPSLYVHTGTHDGSDTPDTPATIDAEHEVRILRAVYYMTQQLANDRTAPRWTQASRNLRRQLFGE